MEIDNKKAIIKFFTILFTILFLAGISTLITWLIIPFLPEEREFRLIGVAVFNVVIVTFFWLGLDDIKTRYKDDPPYYILYICFGVVLEVILIVAIYETQINRKQEQSYTCTYQVHYLDGTVDTAYVTGEHSQYASVDPPGIFGGGYAFCGEEGIYRVRLLKVSKSKKPANGETIKLKNNK